MFAVLSLHLFRYGRGTMYKLAAMMIKVGIVDRKVVVNFTRRLYTISLVQKNFRLKTIKCTPEILFFLQHLIFDTLSQISTIYTLRPNLTISDPIPISVTSKKDVPFIPKLHTNMVTIGCYNYFRYPFWYFF